VLCRGDEKSNIYRTILADTYSEAQRLYDQWYPFEVLSIAPSSGILVVMPKREPDERLRLRIHAIDKLPDSAQLQMHDIETDTGMVQWQCYLWEHEGNVFVAPVDQSYLEMLECQS
jgi:hypothetical protein